MIFFNLRHALRNFRKNRLFTIINIAGLSVGLASFILISGFIKYHISFDKFHKNFDNIYFINQKALVGDKEVTNQCSPFALIHELEGKYPEIKNIARIYYCNYYISNGKHKTSFERNGLIVDSTFLSIFDFPLLKGNPEKVLTGPMSIVLSETLAKKYFPNEDPIGKILKIETGKIFTVTGIMHDMPYNSTLRCQYLISFDALKYLLIPEVESNWDWCMTNTAILLDKDANPKKFEKKIENLPEGKTSKVHSNKLQIYPLSKMHLQFNPENDYRIHMWLAGIIAALILIIAAINYLNLSTAYSSVRVKEIGLRKLAGARIYDIIKQFMGEALVVTAVSLLIAFSFTELILSYIKSLIPEGYTVEYPGINEFVIFILSVSVITGILSGSYPSFYLSSLMPSRAIKGTDKFTLRSPMMSRVLVVLQYVISIILIVTTITIFLQIKYLENLDLGYDNRNIITANCQFTPSDASERYEKLRTELVKHDEIDNIAQSHMVPFYGMEWWEVSLDSLQKRGNYQIDHNHIDFNFIRTFGMKIIRGRNLSIDSLVDREIKTCLINEEAAQIFGFQDSAIGKTIYSYDNKFRIVGIMKNFHPYSVMMPIQPCFYTYTNRQFLWPNFYSVKLKSNANKAKMIQMVTEKFKKAYPDDIIEFFDYSRDFKEMNTGFVTSMGNLFAICAVIAFFIAIIGLFGLVSYITRQRTKEIGIRKANGAITIQLFYFLAKEFLLLIIIANIIAAPAAFLLCSTILNTMPYHIQVPWLVFVITALLSIVVTFLIIGSHIIKVAKTNPVEALRFE